MIYKATKDFPSDEKFALIDQMHRCSVSITSNIAEGFSRRSKKEKSQFYSMAKGSLTELQNQLLVARDVGYVKEGVFDNIAGQSVVVGRLITGLSRSVV